MADASSKLRLKYKLGHFPDENEIERWAELTEHLIRDGNEPESAGHAAAKRVWSDTDQALLKAEADTIKVLLEEARKK
jgi:hypothetical protein